MEAKGTWHRGGHGEAVTTLAQCFEPVWYQQGANTHCSAEIQSSSSGWARDLHDKRESRGSLGLFCFLFSRPDVLRAEMLKCFGHFSDVLGGAA